MGSSTKLLKRSNQFSKLINFFKKFKQKKIERVMQIEFVNMADLTQFE